MKLTVNEAMIYMKQLHGRSAELGGVRSNSANRTRNLWRDKGEETIVEPQYDIKKVDVKIVKIQNAKFRLEAAIKQSNAATVINVDLDMDDLMSPLE